MIAQHPVSTDLWHTLAQQCPWATYFHTPAWAQTIAASIPGMRVHGIGFFDDMAGPVVLPAVARTKKRLLHTITEYKSMEPGVYGGFLAEKPLTPEHVSRMAEALCSLKHGAGRIVETPDMPLHLPPPFIAKTITTHRIILGRPYAEIAAAFSRGQKSNIRQALRKGVQIRMAQTEQDIKHYYCLYQQTRQRWSQEHGPAYPQSLFLNLYRHQNSGVQFWLAEADSAIIAGIIVLVWRQTMVYWHGCSLQASFKLYPNNLLHAKVIEWACDHGINYYDMGPSMDLPGVVRFKESFGAVAQSFTAYRWKT
ncbi:MAG: GNAT family N-acetyltransferase [Desulfobacterota bacterium]|nr:GNAT family N-acetyltransferase [Thermodesulfobacteriota bacterium]